MAAFSLALVLLATPVGSHPAAEGAFRNPAELCDMSTELVARLSAESPDAVPLAEAILEIASQWLGPKHPAIVSSVANLAYAHRLAGDVGQARALYELALGLAEKLLGPEHPTTALALGNLGRVQHQQGELGPARDRLERALAILESTTGQDSLKTATALNDLGNVLHAMGDLTGARARLSRALEIIEKKLGPDHSETATAINNLAMVLLEAGDLTTARRLMNEALRPAIVLREQSFALFKWRFPSSRSLLAGPWATWGLCCGGFDVACLDLVDEAPDAAWRSEGKRRRRLFPSL